MKTGIEIAKCYMGCCGYSLVVFGRCVEIVSNERGIMPLLMIYDKCPEKLAGAAVADRVIGRAAAFILAETKIREVYGEVMSEGAVTVLETAGIKYGYGRLVPAILNREGSDICPLEKLCGDIAAPLDGIMAITGYICRSRDCGGGKEASRPGCS